MICLYIHTHTTVTSMVVFILTSWIQSCDVVGSIDLSLLTIRWAGPSALANPQDVKMVPFHFLEYLSCSWWFPHGLDIPSTNFDVGFWAEQTIHPWLPICDHSASRKAWVCFKLFLGVGGIFKVSVTISFYGTGLLGLCPTPDLEDQWIVLHLASNFSTFLVLVILSGDCAPLA